MSDTISTAFEQIIEELEEERNTLTNRIAEHASQGQYDDVVRLGQHGNQLEGFRSQVMHLRNEWRQHFVAKPDKTPLKRRIRGLRTPQSAYYRPILQSLIELGGTARASEVIALVAPKVQHLLNAYDREPLDSNPRELRWQNAIHWARNDLREQGLIVSGSPQGIWEISDAGRRFVVAVLTRQDATG